MMMMMMIFSVGNPYQPSISTVTGKVSMPGDIQEFQAKYISDTPTPLKKKKWKKHFCWQQGAILQTAFAWSFVQNLPSSLDMFGDVLAARNWIINLPIHLATSNCGSNDGWMVGWFIDWLRFPLGWKMLDITIWKYSSLIKAIWSTSTWSDCLGRSHIKAHLLGCIGAVAMDPRVPGHSPTEMPWNTCAASWHHKPLSWRCVAAAWWVVFYQMHGPKHCKFTIFWGTGMCIFFCNALTMRQKEPCNSVCWQLRFFLQMTTPQRHVQFCAKARLFQIGRKV